MSWAWQMIFFKELNIWVLLLSLKKDINQWDCWGFVRQTTSSYSDLPKLSTLSNQFWRLPFCLHKYDLTSGYFCYLPLVHRPQSSHQQYLKLGNLRIPYALSGVTDIVPGNSKKLVGPGGIA